MKCDENLIGTFNFLLNLKYVKRTGWVKRKVEDPESISETSFQSIAMAMLLSDIYELNFEKLTKIIVLQDIASAMAGDLTPYDKMYFKREEIHKQAIEEFVQCVSNDIAQEYLDLWEEYYSKESLESQIAKEIMQIETCLQALEYELAGYKDMEEFWNNPMIDFKTPELKQFFEMMKKYRKNKLKELDK